VAIEDQEFISFLQGLDSVVLTPDDVFNGYIEKDKACVWVVLCRAACNEQFEGIDIRPIQEKLGDIPRTRVVFEISRKEGSVQLALEFALEFTKQWNVVVDDLKGTIYTPDQLVSLLNSGHANALVGTKY
jgi:hypothetical protein